MFYKGRTIDRHKKNVKVEIQAFLSRFSFGTYILSCNTWKIKPPQANQTKKDNIIPWRAEVSVLPDILL